MMNQTLSDLRDIHLPEAISWWPLAFSWWLLLIGIILCFVGVIWWFRHPQKKKAIIPQALLELEKLQNQYKNNDTLLLQNLSILLRRTAISLYGRKQVAGLTGKKWLTFLDQHWNEKIQPKVYFSNGVGEAFSSTIYQKNTQTDMTKVCQLLESWLNAHK